MKRLILPLALAAMAALTACTPRAEPAATPIGAGAAVIAAESRLLDRGTGKLAPGDAAPDFSYTLPDGTTRRLSDHQGLPVVLNFWATWCLPCVEEMPEIERIYSEAGGELAVLAVNRNELPEAIARFAPRVAVSFPLIANIDGAIGDRYAVTSLPTTYFINSDGTIGAVQIGVLTPSVLAERLKAIR
jgi:thiol-disulfide isomerase/thioredoxin